VTSDSAPLSRTRTWWEIAIVLALGLGESAVYAIVQLAYRLTDATPLADQTTTLNPSRSDREVFDLIYQVLGIGFSIVPVLLVCFLMWQTRRPHATSATASCSCSPSASRALLSTRAGGCWDCSSL
jgi:hypothetical protein